MADATAATGNSTAQQERWYRSVWRWHFYAGLFTVPFVLWLSATGAIYLFKPQVESLIDRPYDSLEITGAPLAPSALVDKAESAVPGSVLHRLILPEEADDARDGDFDPLFRDGDRLREGSPGRACRWWSGWE